MADFRLQVVTQQKTVFNRLITVGNFPGEEGSFGVMANHAPIIAVLKPGKVTVREGKNETEFSISNGFFEMEGNVATLLADEIEGLAIDSDEDEE